MIFRNRQEAGQKLGEELQEYKNSPDTLVLALPRGGVVLGKEVASALHLPLDIIVPRKIGAPGNPEYAIGAIAENGQGIFAEEVVAAYGISPEYIEQETAQEQREAERRLKLYRGSRPPRNLRDKTVILVDDGIATGFTMRAAISSARAEGAKKIVLSVPVAARDTLDQLEPEVDEIVVLYIPEYFGAVGAFYEEFGQTSDEEVIDLLQE